MLCLKGFVTNRLQSMKSRAQFLNVAGMVCFVGSLCAKVHVEPLLVLDLSCWDVSPFVNCLGRKTQSFTKTNSTRDLLLAFELRKGKSTCVSKGGNKDEKRGEEWGRGKMDGSPGSNRG